MASASIESTVTAPVAKATVTNSSRDDLEVNDVVLVNSVNNGTAYTWSLAYVPEGSTAVFSGSVFNQSPGTFTVDREGPYLVRLVLTIPTVEIVSVPIPAGQTLTINGVPLTSVSSARTPGANNFNGSLATPALVAAEIVAALNDGANSFSSFVAPTVALGSAVLNLNPVISGASIVPTSSTALMVPYLTSFSEQFVRLRALTTVGGLKLVSAGERVDIVPVPVDITFTGWADEQNFNLLTLLGFVSTSSTTGRVYYVDASTGDFHTIQAAMDAAQAQAPSVAAPWVILVRPGVNPYVEDLTFYPYVHVFGWPGGQSTNIVRIRASTTAGHTMALPLAGDLTVLSNLYFEQLSATSNDGVTLSGAGEAIFHKSVFTSEGAGTPQGAAVALTGSVSLRAYDCRFSGTPAASTDSYSFRAGSGTATVLKNCRLLIRGLYVEPLSSVHLLDCEVTAASDYAVFSQSSNLLIEYSQISGGATQDVGINPLGAAVASAVSAAIRWSSYGTLTFDITGVVGATSLYQGATEHGALTFPGGIPSTLSATTPGDTLYYDNTVTGLTASNVQDALDEIYTFAAAVRTLDDAYDGGDPGPTGSGRTIVADAGPVQIVDAASPSDPIPAGNTNGGLDVVGMIRVGAINKPELTLDPNPYGNGPEILLGREIWANDAPNGSTALILGDASGSPAYHNYNLTVGTKSADGGSRVGQVLVRGGDSLDPSVTAGAVYIQSGSGTDGGGGDGSHIFVAPGASAAGASGSLFLIRPEDGTAATLTAAGAFVGGVTGLIRFATDFGAIEISVDAADNLAAVIAKFNATGFVTAADSGGGVLQLTTVGTGATAEVFFLNADIGVDTALGVFAGQTMVAGTWPSYMEIKVSGAGEITFGPNDPNPMVYNSVTGKLTVPGLIDPIGLILDQTVPITADPNKGVIFIGDGTGGTILGNFYYRFEGGPLQDVSAAVSGSTSLDVEDEGTPIGSFTTFNFTGSGVVASDGGGGVADITITSGGLLAIEDEGVSIETDATLIDFVGAGVTATSTGPNSVQVTIPGGSGALTAVSQESFAATGFSFSGGLSSVVLGDTPDTGAAIQGLILLFRNGKADMTNVGPAIPVTATQYRIAGGALQIGADITGTTDSYLLVYPSV